MRQSVSPYKWLRAWVLGGALVLASTAASAQAPEASESPPPPDDAFFQSVIERRYVLPERIFLPYAVFIDVPPAASEGSHFVGLNIGVLYGFAGRWMVDALVVPLVLSEPFSYGNPQVGLAYQVVESRAFELGLTTRAFFSSTGFFFRGFEVGIPTLFRFGDHLRLDVGAYVPISTSGQPVSVLGVSGTGLRLPVSAAYQLNPNFHVALDTGLSFYDLRQASGTFALPLGVTVGFSTNIRGFWFDVVPFFSFPTFYGRDGVNTRVMLFGLVTGVSMKL